MATYYARAFQRETSEERLQELMKIWPGSAKDLGRVCTDFTRGVIYRGSEIVKDNGGKGYEWEEAVRLAEEMSDKVSPNTH